MSHTALQQPWVMEITQLGTALATIVGVLVVVLVAVVPNLMDLEQGAH